MNKLITSIKIRFSVIGLLFKFFWQNKMWWMIPMIIILVAFFLLMIFAQSTPLGPFIYPIF